METREQGEQPASTPEQQVKTVSVPAEGWYFDRVDHPNGEQARVYYVKGAQAARIGVVVDPRNPTRWIVLVAWLRKGEWLSHQWDGMTREQAQAMADAVGIGFEACSGGAQYLGLLQQERGR